MKTRSMIQYIAVFLLCGVHLIGNAQEKTFNLTDINRLVGISSLEISPDGKSALFMTSKRDLENNRFRRKLMVLDIASKAVREVGTEIQGISAPTWTNDGKGIRMITRREEGRQIYVLDLDTGRLEQITFSKRNVIRYAWSPDGTQLAYFVRDERKATVGKNPYNDSFEVGSNDYLIDKTPLSTSVWLLSVGEKMAKRITPEDFTVATGLSTSALSWSPNGKLLAFTKYPSSFSGDSDLGRNFVYSIDEGKLKAATKNTQRESGPLFAPDSKSLVYRYPRDGFPSNMADLHQVDLKTGKITNISKRLDRSVSNIQWLSNGKVLLRGIDHFGNAAWEINQGKYLKIGIGDLASISAWSVTKDGAMVFTATKKDYPVEIYYKSSLSATPVQLTNYNEFVKNIDLGKQESFTWESNDGLRPNGVLTYPPNFDPKKKYPLVLQIHGGPSASSVLGFSPVPQAMAAKGWIVFQPNYRGSTNLGNAFQAAISKDPSEGPGHDVITGVEALKTKPYIASDKVAVSGWSYGGWMTSWLIGRYPKVWTAAVAGAAPVDLTDMYSLNDLNRMRRHSMVESPYVGNNLEWAYKNSPISNFSKIQTPTLIMSKTGDYRVTITGSYKLYGALRDNDVPVQFIAYPGPGHFPRDPVRSMNVYQRWIDWLDHYLKETKQLTVR